MRQKAAAVAVGCGCCSRASLGARRRCGYTRWLGRLDLNAVRRLEDPEDLHRPDWYAEIRAAGGTENLRKLYAVTARSGRTPFAISKDAVYFTSDDPDPIAFAELGLPDRPPVWRL
jgi:hypothetical protein